MNTIYRIKHRLFAAAALAVLFSMSAVAPVIAQTVLQGYASDEKLQRGMLVTLSKDDQSKVKAVTSETLEQLKGVVADANDSPVTLAGEGQKVFVATTGKYEVLVSNENGKIEQGDYISGSSLDGIAMKANDTQKVILGRAVSKFEGGGDSVGKTAAKDGKSVEFGRIQVDIGVGESPILKKQAKANVPESLQKATDQIADKQVAASRIYLAILVLFVTALIAGITLFSGVRSTVISIGRNPLSKGIIYKGLFQVLLLSLIIFLTGLFGVYLLIKL